MIFILPSQGFQIVNTLKSLYYSILPILITIITKEDNIE